MTGWWRAGSTSGIAWSRCSRRRSSRSSAGRGAFGSSSRWQGADVIFLDDSFYPVYWVEFTPDVRIVQLWHASGAFKTVGYSRSASAGNPPFNPYGRVHKNTTHVIVSSDFDVPFYAEALGVPEDRVHSTGIPRMDRYFDPARQGCSHRGGARPLPTACRSVGVALCADLSRRAGRRGDVRPVADRPRGASTRSPSRRTRSSCSSTTRSFTSGWRSPRRSGTAWSRRATSRST